MIAWVVSIYVACSLGLGLGEFIAKKTDGEQAMPSLFAGLKMAVVWPYTVYQLFNR